VYKRDLIDPFRMSNALTNLVPVFNSTNYQDWAPRMKNYLLSAGQWRQMAKARPEPDYPYIDVEVPVTDSKGKPTTEIRSKPDFMQDPKNQAEIDSWDNNNDKARGNIMLRLHSVVTQKYYTSEVALTIWEGIAAEYGKPGIAAIFQEFTGTMNTSIPGNSDPSFTIEKICSHFMRMATSSCTLPEHLKVMILISKMPPSMTALIQLICQTDNVEKLDIDKIKRMIIMNWEQRLSMCHNNPSYQPQAAKKISAVQCSGPPPSFQQQQPQPQQEEQGQNQGQNQGSQRGGWCGGCRGTYRGTRAGKNKQNQQQQAARPIEECAPSCHDFRRFPTFLCPSPKRPHSFTQPMTCFSLSLSTQSLSYLSPHLFFIFLFSHFGYQGQVRSIRFTRRLVSLGLPKEFYLLGSYRPFKPHRVHVGNRPLDLLRRGHLWGIQDLGQG